LAVAAEGSLRRPGAGVSAAGATQRPSSPGNRGAARPPIAWAPSWACPSSASPSWRARRVSRARIRPPSPLGCAMAL